jgi:hypothetical protein
MLSYERPVEDNNNGWYSAMAPDMICERKILLKTSLGFAASLVAVLIIFILNRNGIYLAWAQIIAAALIGSVAGIAEKSPGKIALGMILACMGWFCGEYVSRFLFHSIVMWIFVGGFIGLTAGILEKSPKSIIGGICLGAIGGLMGVAAGLSTIMIDQPHGLDMQAMGIMGAGIFINLLLALKRPKGIDGTIVEADEINGPESSSKDLAG